jgi:ABC-type uncharacterized transport system permease subunit
MAELLVWPTVIAYGEAALVYAGELRGHRRYDTFGIWGVRIGWLAQTALLVAQARSADGFPWGTWAGALNLLSWLVVSGYLVWGCRPRYRLVGLAVMPLAACLLVLAWAGGGTALDAHGDGWALATHAALMLAGLASFTVAAAMAALYVFEERRLKRHDAGVLRLWLPSLEALDRLAARAALAGLGFLSAGIVVGLVWLDVNGLDAAMTVAVLIWVVYTLALVVRWEAGVRGRRFARLLLAGLLLVAAVLPLTHFAA